MSITYEVIPWDLEGFNTYGRQFPTVDSLDKAARLMTCPADSIVAWQDGQRRGLTTDEKAELQRHRDRLLASTPSGLQPPQ